MRTHRTFIPESHRNTWCFYYADPTVRPGSQAGCKNRHHRSRARANNSGLSLSSCTVTYGRAQGLQVQPPRYRMKPRTQTNNHLLDPIAPDGRRISCETHPASLPTNSRTQKVKQVPSYLHVWSWKPPEGIEAQAGILYYNRSPNLQQKPKGWKHQTSRNVLPPTPFSCSVLLLCFHNRNTTKIHQPPQRRSTYQTETTKAMLSPDRLGWLKDGGQDLSRRKLSRAEHPLPSWGAGMVGQGEGKPVSYRHACIFLKSQSLLGSFKIPIPGTSLEGDPSEAPADRKVRVPHPPGMKELSRPPAAQGTQGEQQWGCLNSHQREFTSTDTPGPDTSLASLRADSMPQWPWLPPAPPLPPPGKGKDEASDLPGGFAALLHGDLVRLPLVLRHWRHKAGTEETAGPSRAASSPPGPAANLRSIFLATSV